MKGRKEERKKGRKEEREKGRKGERGMWQGWKKYSKRTQYPGLICSIGPTNITTPLLAPGITWHLAPTVIPTTDSGP